MISIASDDRTAPADRTKGIFRSEGQRLVLRLPDNGGKLEITVDSIRASVVALVLSVTPGLAIRFDDDDD